MAKQKTVPLGDFVPLTETELDEFLAVAPADVELLRSQWKKYAAPKYIPLIDATQYEELISQQRGLKKNAGPKKSKLTPEYRFNPKLGTTGRYIDSKGRTVKEAVIKKQLEQVLSGTKQEMTNAYKQLQSGQIGAQEWYDTMRAKMKLVHTIEGSIAKGGWGRMSQADWGAIGQISKFQYGKLANFARQIVNGEQPLNGRGLVRTGMYAEAGRGTYQQMLRREADNNGYTEERRVRSAVDSCDDCVNYEAEGWQPIGTLPSIGDSQCLTHCQCEFEFR
jgi:hypothetical protein